MLCKSSYLRSWLLGLAIGVLVFAHSVYLGNLTAYFLLSWGLGLLLIRNFSQVELEKSKHYILMGIVSLLYAFATSWTYYSTNQHGHGILSFLVLFQDSLMQLMSFYLALALLHAYFRQGELNYKGVFKALWHLGLVILILLELIFGYMFLRDLLVRLSNSMQLIWMGKLLESTLFNCLIAGVLLSLTTHYLQQHEKWIVIIRDIHIKIYQWLFIPFCLLMALMFCFMPFYVSLKSFFNPSLVTTLLVCYYLGFNAYYKDGISSEHLNAKAQYYFVLMLHLALFALLIFGFYKFALLFKFNTWMSNVSLSVFWFVILISLSVQYAFAFIYHRRLDVPSIAKINRDMVMFACVILFLIPVVGAKIRLTKSSSLNIESETLADLSPISQKVSY